MDKDPISFIWDFGSLFRFKSLGRSSGKGSFSIWTHNMKGKEWHKSFIPHGAPDDTEGIPAVTLQAGEQLLGMFYVSSPGIDRLTKLFPF